MIKVAPIFKQTSIIHKHTLYTFISALIGFLQGLTSEHYIKCIMAYCYTGCKCASMSSILLTWSSI